MAIARVLHLRRSVATFNLLIGSHSRTLRFLPAVASSSWPLAVVPKATALTPPRGIVGGHGVDVGVGDPGGPEPTQNSSPATPSTPSWPPPGSSPAPTPPRGLI
jgi:hypothetical protein